MNDVMPVPASIKAPRTAQVNLVPPEVAKRRARGRSRMVVIVTVLGMIGLLGAVVAWAELQASAAQNALNKENALTDELNLEIAKYAHVPVIQAELANAESARTYAGAIEIDWLNLWIKIFEAMPVDARFDSVQWEGSTPLGVVAPSDSLFDGPRVGVLQFTGWTLEHVVASDLADSLNAIYGVSDAKVITSTRRAEDGFVLYEITGELVITPELLTYRFSAIWDDRQVKVQAVRDAADVLVEASEVLDTAERELRRISEEDASARSAQRAVVEAAEAAVEDAIEALEAAQKALDEYDAKLQQDRRDAIDVLEAEAAAAEQERQRQLEEAEAAAAEGNES